MAEYTTQSSFVGKMTYQNDGSLKIENKGQTKVIDKETMQGVATEYKGANRIHKPIPLLFWTDCKNGQYNNWVK